jgi:hypothetical protein
MKDKLVHLGIISIFVSLYFLVATISMINSVAFFDLSHSGLMSWSLAIGFELGAAASLAAIIILDKTNKTMVWSLFLLLTAFQMMANSYHAFVNLEDYMGWIELFGLEEEEPIFQKRVLSVVSGAVLPLVALGFIKSLTDYIRPENAELPEQTDNDIPEEAKAWQGAFDIETPVAGSAEPITEKEIIPEASEEAVEKDLYSRDAEKAKPPVEIGEVHIAPETVDKTDNAVADDVEKPVDTEHITTQEEMVSTKVPKEPLKTRGFIKTGTQPLSPPELP